MALLNPIPSYHFIFFMSRLLKSISDTMATCVSVNNTSGLQWVRYATAIQVLSTTSILVTRIKHRPHHASRSGSQALPHEHQPHSSEPVSLTKSHSASPQENPPGPIDRTSTPTSPPDEGGGAAPERPATSPRRRPTPPPPRRPLQSALDAARRVRAAAAPAATPAAPAPKPPRRRRDAREKPRPRRRRAPGRDGPGRVWALPSAGLRGVVGRLEGQCRAHEHSGNKHKGRRGGGGAPLKRRHGGGQRKADFRPAWGGPATYCR